jgi:hypothetical protein
MMIAEIKAGLGYAPANELVEVMKNRAADRDEALDRF